MRGHEAGKAFGLLAEFATPGDLLRAAREMRGRGYRRYDTHSPFPIHGTDSALGLGDSPLGWLVVVAAVAGVGLAFTLQWWIHTRGYPLIVSGKPYNSFPAFIPIAFETGVLFSAFAAVLGMLALNRLPRYHHPVFASRRFERFSDDAFFLSVEAADPRYQAEATRRLLEELGATAVEELPG